MTDAAAIERLFDAVADDREDVSRWAVLADALLESGDPRGELISAQLSQEGLGLQKWVRPSLAARIVLANHAERLFGSLAQFSEQALHELVSFEWYRGLIERVTVEDPGLMPAALTCSAARLVNGAGFFLAGSSTIQTVSSTLAAASGTLERLSLSATERSDLSLADVFANVPRLHSLGLANIQPLVIPEAFTARARELRLFGLEETGIERALDSKWPSLKTLELKGHTCTGSLLRRVLRPGRFPGLIALEVDTDQGLDALGAMVDSALTESLEQVVMVGSVARETVSWLSLHRGAFKRLRKIELVGSLKDGWRWPRRTRTREVSRVQGLALRLCPPGLRLC